MNAISPDRLRLPALTLAAALLAACSGGGGDAPAVQSESGQRPVLRIDDASAGEGDGALRFTVTLDGDPGQRVTVAVAVEDGTARARSGYRPPATTRLEFAPGDTRRTLAVPLVDDRVVETSETLRVRLTVADAAVAVARGEAVGRIADDDRPYLHGDDPAADGDFVKLDRAGRPLPADAAEWACVRDARTGLVWEVKTGDGGLHDRDHRYAWRHSDARFNGGDPGALSGPDGRCLSDAGEVVDGPCNTEAFVQQVRAEGLCGFRDWRLPTRAELRNLVDFTVAERSATTPTIDTGHFPHTVSGPYWTATPSADRADEAWLVDFWDGDVQFGAKGNTYRVRLVRGARPWGDPVASPCRDDLPASAPAARFERGADTVRDRYTGLVWRLCALGQSGPGCETGAGEERLVSRAEAEAEAENLARQTGQPWRLPTVKELESILELGCREPSVDQTVFPKSPIRPFWTATPGAGAPDSAWQINTFLGGSYFFPVTQQAAVRLVRPIAPGE